jgi:hypothetical protein
MVIQYGHPDSLSTKDLTIFIRFSYSDMIYTSLIHFVGRFGKISQYIDRPRQVLSRNNKNARFASLRRAARALPTTFPRLSDQASHAWPPRDTLQMSIKPVKKRAVMT